MPKETINTNYELPMPETCNMYVESLKKEYSKNNPGVFFYKLTVTTENETPVTFSVYYFKNQMVDLLRALGAREVVTGKFEFDPQDMIGKWITAKIIHEKDKTGVERARLVDIKSYETPNPSPKKGEKWDEQESPL